LTDYLKKGKSPGGDLSLIYLNLIVEFAGWQ